jgi:hypothetical protein
MADHSELRKRAAQQAAMGNYWAGKCVGLIDKLAAMAAGEMVLIEEITATTEVADPAEAVALLIEAGVLREECRCGCDRKYHEDRKCCVCNDFCIYTPVYLVSLSTKGND